MKKRKFKRGEHANLFFGTALSIIALVFTLSVFSVILSLFKNPIAHLGIMGITSYLSSGALSAFLNAKRKGEGGTLFAILSSLIASSIFLAIGLIVSGGKSTLSLLMNVLCYLLISALFAKLGALKKKRYRHH